MPGTEFLTPEQSSHQLTVKIMLARKMAQPYILLVEKLLEFFPNKINQRHNFQISCQTPWNGNCLFLQGKPARLAEAIGKAGQRYCLAKLIIK
jgi:hypothetical protein